MEYDDHFDTSMVYGDSSGAVYAKLMHHISLLQIKAKKNVLACLENIVDARLSSRETGAITLCDYGTADGVNAIPILNEVINFLQNRLGHDQQIMIVFEDQAKNDFNTLFRSVHEKLDFIHLPIRFGNLTHQMSNKNLPRTTENIQNAVLGEAGETKLNTSNRKVFIMACGTSMYKQCLTDGSLDFGMSSIALHWLSKRPCKIENGILPSDGSQEEQLFRKQSSEDWINFLTCREKELKLGGYLCLLVAVTMSDNVCDAVGKVLRHVESTMKDLLSENVISQEELRDTNIFFYRRKREEITAPFCGPNNAFQSLKLQHLSIRMVTVVEQETNACDYATAVVNVVKSWFTNTLLKALADTRTDVEKKEIADGFYKKLLSNMEHLKDKVDVTYNVAEVIIQKT